MPALIASSAAAATELPLHLFFPLLSSLLYVAAALSLKRATQTGGGVWRTTFVMNVVAAVCFAALLPLAPGPAGPRPPWQPLTLAMLFVAGQSLTMLALNRGDVSVATPVIGLKVVFVTFFVALVVGDRMLADYWLSAGMSALGIALLNLGGGRPGVRHHHVLLTVLTSLAAAACYAMFDTLVRKWSPAWGVGRLLPSAMSMAAILSLGLWPLFEGRLRDLPRASRGPVLSGAIFMGLQAISLVATLGLYPDTTRINVVYNSRGLWSVLAVWLVGHWWGNTERHAGRAVLLWRLAGAGLMLGAIAVAVIRPVEGLELHNSPQLRAVR